MKLGTFALLNAPTFVELAGFAGFDFVIVDCEHSASTPAAGSELMHMLRAATAGGTEPWVRVRANDPIQIGVVVENGARGIVVPHVRNRQDAERAVAAATLQPGGTRGASPFGREIAYGFRQPQPVIVGALIEDPEALDQIDAIATTPGLGALFFGHFDLATALGRPNPLLPDEVIEAHRDRVYAAAKRAGIATAAFTWDGATARALAERGADYVAVSADVSLLAAALRKIRDDARGAP